MSFGHIPLDPLPKTFSASHEMKRDVNLLVQVILQYQDLNKARQIWRKYKKQGNEILQDFADELSINLVSDHVSSESACALLSFLLKHPEINFSISDKALKTICLYQYNQINASATMDESLILKNKDFIGRLFPFFAEKNAFHWIMAFDCIYQNMRKTRKHKLTTTNKYLKSLSLRQYIQLFIKCIEEINYERNYGGGNQQGDYNFSSGIHSIGLGKEAREGGDRGEDCDFGGGGGNSGDAFSKDLANTSNKIRHKQRIQSLQIFAQRIILHVHSHSLSMHEKFWEFLKVIYAKQSKNNSLDSLEKVLIQSGLPWFVLKNNNSNKKGEAAIKIDSLASEIIRPFGHEKLYVLFPKSILRIKNKTSIYLPFYDDYSTETILCNEELFFQIVHKNQKEITSAILEIYKKKQADNLLIEKLLEQKINIDLQEFLENEENEENEEREKKETTIRILAESAFFETRLYHILQDKSISPESIHKWTQRTGNVNLNPTFLNKIQFSDMKTELPARFSFIQSILVS